MNYINYDSTDACLNMAFDEFMLEGLTSGAPVLRLWQNAPSVIVGLNQNVYSEVNLPYLEEHDITLARRVTGGGAVYHDLGNLNYTIAGRTAELPETGVQLVADALRTLGVPAEVSGRNDILVGGRKCSGYARRVWRDRTIIHGTLMYDVDFEALTAALSVPGSKLAAAGVASVRSRVANLEPLLPVLNGMSAFRAALLEILSDGGRELPLTTEQIKAIEARADSKFRNWEWIYGRSRAAGFRARKKFPCGTVEAEWEVDGGILTAVRFSGDFLGGLPVTVLEERLCGTRFSPEALLQKLEGASPGVDAFFDSLSAQQLLTLFL